MLLPDVVVGGLIGIAAWLVCKVLLRGMCSGLGSDWASGVVSGYGFARDPGCPAYREARQYLQQHKSHQWPELKPSSNQAASLTLAALRCVAEIAAAPVSLLRTEYKAYLVVSCYRMTNAIDSAAVWSSPEWEQSRQLPNMRVFVAYAVLSYESYADARRRLLEHIGDERSRYHYLVSYLEKRELSDAESDAESDV